MPDDDFAIDGDPFTEREPRAFGEPDRPWGRKTFKSVPDERVRMTLIWLQDFSNLVRTTIEDEEQLSYEDAARRCGVSVQNLQAVLRGEQRPTWQTMAHILAALTLDVTFSDPAAGTRPCIREDDTPPVLKGTRRKRARPS